MRILNDLDHELGPHKGAENQIYIYTRVCGCGFFFFGENYIWTFLHISINS